jgi:hypothetical protein
MARKPPKAQAAGPLLAEVVDSLACDEAPIGRPRIEIQWAICGSGREDGYYAKQGLDHDLVNITQRALQPLLRMCSVDLLRSPEATRVDPLQVFWKFVANPEAPPERLIENLEG